MRKSHDCNYFKYTKTIILMNGELIFFVHRYILWIYIPKGGYGYAGTGKRVGKQSGNPIVKRGTQKRRN